MNNCTAEKENEHTQTNDTEFFYQQVKARRAGASERIHDIIEILFIDSGSLEVTCDGRSATANAGDVVLFRPNSIHTTQTAAPLLAQYWVLRIAPRFLINFLPQSKASDSLLWLSINRQNSKFIWKKEEVADSEITEGLSKLITESKHPNGNSELAIRIAAATVALGLLRKREDDGQQSLDNAGITELIYEAVIYVNNNYASHITAEEVSRHLNVSYSYFSRSFKRIMGISFRQHLNSVRINHGESLLLNTDFSVSKISELCGFESVSHFISTYRKLKNSSPSKARLSQ